MRQTITAKIKQIDFYLKHKNIKPERIIKLYVPVFALWDTEDTDYMNKKIRTILSIMMIVAVSAAATACNFNADKAGEAFDHLGQNISNAVSEDGSEETAVSETEITVETPSDVSEEVPEETEAVPTATPMPTATPAPTATPTPTPAPERVDFSELTEDQISDTITIESEEFEESYADDENEITYATFSGNRLLVSEEAAPNIQTSVNLILDGFYQEAEGIYNRYTSEAQAEYALIGEEEEQVFETYDVTVSYEYGFNGRVLSVRMAYAAVSGEETLEEDIEYIAFDMYTGQYINTASVIADQGEFNRIAGEALAFSTDNEEDTAESFSDIIIFAQDSGNGVYVIGTDEDGDYVRTLIDVQNLGPVFNRYGRILYGIA